MSTNPPIPGGILPPEMLNKFRQKYGKAYADMSDQQLSQAIVRKWPAYQRDLVQPQRTQPASVPQPAAPPRPTAQLVPPQRDPASQAVGNVFNSLGQAANRVGSAIQNIPGVKPIEQAAGAVNNVLSTAGEKIPIVGPAIKSIKSYIDPVASNAAYQLFPNPLEAGAGIVGAAREVAPSVARRTLLTEPEIQQTARNLGLPVNEIREAASLPSQEIMRRYAYYQNALRTAIQSNRSIGDIGKELLQERAGLYHGLNERLFPVARGVAPTAERGVVSTPEFIARNQELARNYARDMKAIDEANRYQAPTVIKVANEVATQRLAGKAAAQGAARQQVQHAVETMARGTASDMEKAAHPPMIIKPVVPPQVQAKMAQGIVANPSFKPVMDYIAQSNKVRQIGGTLGDKLYALQGSRQAEGIQMSRVLDQVTKDAKPGDMEAVYHELERPTGKLTPPQQAIYNVLAPLRDSTEATNQALPGRQGNLISGIGYVRREPLQVGSAIDRVRAGVSGLGRSLLRKTTEGVNHRKFWTMVDDETGAKVLAHIEDDGKVTAIRGDSRQTLGTTARKSTFREFMDRDITPLKRRIAQVQQQLQQLYEHPSNAAEPRLAAADQTAALAQQIQQEASKVFDESLNRGGAARSAAVRRALFSLGAQWKAWRGAAYGGAERINSLNRTLDQLNTAIDEAVKGYNPDTLDQTAFRANNGRTYRVTPATTREIESQTDQRYYKNAAYSVLSDYLDTAQAARANQFLQQAPLDPDWNSIAVPAKSMAGINAPKGWRVPDIPQLSEWKMDPRIAQRFEAIVGRGRQQPAAWVHAIESMQRGLVQVGLTANFVAHPMNMAGWNILNRGVVRWLNPGSYPRYFSSLAWAANQTIHMGDDYLEMLRQGAPLQYVNNVNVTKRLVEMAQQELDNHPSLLEGLGSQLGLTPNRILKAIRTKSHDLAFMSSDIAYLQGVRERMLEGKGTAEAIGATNRHFPTYRVPDWMPNVLRNNDFILFMPYHASSMEALANIMKDSIGAGGKGFSAEAAEKAALVAIAGAVLGPTGSTINRWVQSQTGNPAGRVKASGPTSLPSQVARTITGDTKALYAMESFMTPSPITAMGISFIQYEAMHKAEPIQQTAVQLLKQFQQNATPYLFQQLQGAGWDQDIGKALLSIPGDLFLTLPKPPTKRSANPKTWY